jgi:hypothetical protein
MSFSQRAVAIAMGVRRLMWVINAIYIAIAGGTSSRLRCSWCARNEQLEIVLTLVYTTPQVARRLQLLL